MKTADALDCDDAEFVEVDDDAEDAEDGEAVDADDRGN